VQSWNQVFNSKTQKGANFQTQAAKEWLAAHEEGAQRPQWSVPHGNHVLAGGRTRGWGGETEFDGQKKKKLNG